MVSRRALLGGLAGASAGLAGCIVGFCGDPFPGFRLDLTLVSVVEDGDGWRSTVDATVDYLNVGDEEEGVAGLAIGAYDPAPTLLDEATVGSLRWGDVPEENREDDGCAPEGAVTKRAELVTPEPPHAIGPRFDSDDTLEAFDDRDLERIGALRYARGRGTSGREGDGDDSDWPPETVGAGSYEPTDVVELPWPTPDDVAVESSPGVTDLGLRIEPHCWERRGSHQLFLDGGTFRLHWDRPVPEAGSSRPVLLHAERSGATVHLEIGLRDVPHVPERHCQHRRYVATGSVAETGTDGDTPPVVERITVTHLDADGEPLERREHTETD